MEPLSGAHHRRQSTQTELFIERNFVSIAFVASAIALLVISPASLIIGMALGLGLSRYFYPNLVLGQREKVLTIFNTTITIVGGVASLLKLLPSAASAGIGFKVVPLFASMAIGSSLYRLCRAI